MKAAKGTVRKEPRGRVFRISRVLLFAEMDLNKCGQV